MADDAPYIVYVEEPKAYNSASEHNIANEVEYADEEYLDFSNEEEDESDSNSEDDDEGELHNEAGIVEHQVTIEQEGRAADIQSVAFKWTYAATVHLIKAYQSFETSLISGEVSMSQVWDQVAKKLQELGYEVTPLQCKNKFGSLKQIYEKSKEQEINSGVPVKKWIYMDLMESIMTEMEKYRSYSNDAWDSPKCKEVKSESMQVDSQELEQEQNHPVQGVYKWENPAILALIDQYRKYQGALDSGTISQKILFRLIEKNMQNAGYSVTATQCMVKIHSLKKTYKSIKEYNQVNRVIPKRWRYYDLMDSIINGTVDTTNYDSLEEVSKTLAEIKSEEPTPSHVFKWSRRAIEILVSAYREHRPPLHDTKLSRHKVWQTVAQRLRKGGYSVSVAQCKSKISGMLKLYKRNKSGAGGRGWNVRGSWYSRLIESLVDKPKTTQKEESRKIRAESQAKDRRPENVLDQLIICEENKERRHRENMEQRQQLIDIMGQLLERLS